MGVELVVLEFHRGDQGFALGAAARGVGLALFDLLPHLFFGLRLHHGYAVRILLMAQVFGRHA